MQPNIDIRLNGQTIDYKSLKSFPLSIVKETDKFLEFVGAKGSTSQNVLNRLVIPATKNNSSIVENAHIPTGSKPNSKKKFSLVVIINGAVTFSGRCILTTPIRNGYYPTEYSFRTLGDSLSIWEILEGINLCDIPMGYVEWIDSNIRDSQTGTVDSGWSHVWAPKVYGKPSGEKYPFPPDDEFNYMFTSWDFRPDIYFHYILNKIMEFIGYSYSSKFIETTEFKDWVNVYTNGSKWKLAFEPLNQEVHVQRTIPLVTGTVDTQVPFNLEIKDEQNQWIVDELTVAESGCYEIYHRADGINSSVSGQYIQIRMIDPVSGIDPYGVYGNFTYTYLGNCWNRDHAITYRQGFPRVNLHLRAGTKITYFFSGNFVGTSTMTGGYFRLVMKDDVIPGTKIDIASTLPCVPSKDWIRAISHQFCLAWNVNNIIRQTLIEPRFDVPPIWYFGSLKYDGYYHNPNEIEPITECLDSRKISLDFVQPFGRDLIIGWKEDSSDPVYEYFENRRNESSLPYSSKITFTNDRCKKGKVKENPVYSKLWIGSTNTVGATGTEGNGNLLPWILPSGFDIKETLLEENSQREVIGELPEEPTFEANPKCGKVYRNVNEVYWEGNDNEPVPYSLFSVLIMQDPVVNTNNNYNLFPIRGGYCNVNSRPFPNETFGTSQQIKGFVSTYWLQYLKIIDVGELMKGKFNYSNLNISQETFRKLKRVQVGYQHSNWILLKVDNFKPTAALTEPTKLELIKYEYPDQEFYDSIEHNDYDELPIIHIQRELNPE